MRVKLIINFAFFIFCCIPIFVLGQAKPASGEKNYDKAEVEFNNNQTRLSGIILSPKNQAKSPGVIIIHGSGNSDRTQDWAKSFAEGLVARGIVVMLPDKRGSGKSGGDWKSASFEDLADDAIAGVDVLRQHPQVISNMVGVLGLSQGGHIAPLAGTRSINISFVINVSGSTVPIAEQTFDEVEKLAERSKLTAEQIERVNALHRLVIDYARTGKNWERYHSLLNKELKSELAGRGIIEPFPREQNHWVWQWAKIVGGYDPLPYWQKLQARALIVYGARDTQIRIEKSVSRLIGALDSGHRQYTLLIYGDSGHALYQPETRNLKSDFLDYLSKWIKMDSPIGFRRTGKKFKLTDVK